MHSGKRRTLWKELLITAAPIILAGAVMVFGFKNFRSGSTIQWGNGMETAEPVHAERVVAANDSLIYEVDRKTEVKAASTGTITDLDVSGGSLTIHAGRTPAEGHGDEGGMLLQYFGLTSIRMQNNQHVAAGQVIGTIEPRPSNPDPRTAELQFRVVCGGQVLAPPASIARLFTSAGQQIYARDCAGCHVSKNVIPLKGGKMANGEAPTDEAVKQKIAHGGPGAKGFMPPFEHSLSQEELRAVTAFVCNEHCTQTEGFQSGQLPRRALQARR